MTDSGVQFELPARLQDGWRDRVIASRHCADGTRRGHAKLRVRLVLPPRRAVARARRRVVPDGPSVTRPHARNSIDVSRNDLARW